MNSSLEQRFHELEVHYAEATTLLHIQGTLISDMQVHSSTLTQTHNDEAGVCCICHTVVSLNRPRSRT